VPEASWVPEGDGGQTLEENWLFRLRRERFRSRMSGQVHDYYVMHLPDAVHVIALTPDRRLVLVRQFRAGSGRDSLETPGGLVEPGEDPLVAGVRELREETGYEGDPPILLGTVWAVPSILTSRITTILVTNAHRVGALKLDHAEEVSVELVPTIEIPQMIRDGRIDHALVVSGLLWWLVAELPGPLTLPEPPRWRTLRIARVMATIGLIALFLALLVNPGLDRLIPFFCILGTLGAFVLLGAATWRLLSPRRRTILERAAMAERTRRMIRLLNIYGR
jgi:8-oxo-dGTP pyrophosphatase MutT (NUDIX family)